MKPGTFDLADVKRRMQSSLGVLKQELGGLRTGRASPSLVEPLTVEAYGSPMPMNQVASISIPEPRLISIQVWDQGVVKAVEKAIRDSSLGLNPSIEGTTVRVRIPELNQERRQELVKVAHKYAEAARVAVRHVRRDGLDHLKKLQKDGHVSEDEIKRHEGEVQKATDQMITEIDQALAQKEKEVMSV
jgi:ribosome recycling factor